MEKYVNNDGSELSKLDRAIISVFDAMASKRARRIGLGVLAAGISAEVGMFATMSPEEIAAVSKPIAEGLVVGGLGVVGTLAAALWKIRNVEELPKDGEECDDEDDEVSEEGDESSGTGI